MHNPRQQKQMFFFSGEQYIANSFPKRYIRLYYKTEWVGVSDLHAKIDGGGVLKLLIQVQKKHARMHNFCSDGQTFWLKQLFVQHLNTNKAKVVCLYENISYW